MRRLLLLLAALSLCLLAYGTAYYPDYAAFWLASGEPTYQIVRLLLAGALLVQFATNPPRNIYFRLLCGFIAISAASWAIQQSLGFQMLYLDTLSFLGASVATGITALEFTEEKEEFHHGKNIFVA
jgi:hypothetical protein